MRRIDEQTKLKDCRTEETTTYDPAVNEKIADDMLAFDAPVAQRQASGGSVPADQRTPANPSKVQKANEGAVPLREEKAPVDPTAIAKARKVLDEMAAMYKSLGTYKAEGTVTVDVDAEVAKVNWETSFSILLKKPNRYLISWTQKNGMMPSIVLSGAVWSDGTQPYLYMGMLHAYSKMTSDEMAIATATGISGGSAMTITSLFLPSLENYASLSRLKDPVIERTEKIGDEECYVVSATSIMSKKETLWISKSTHFVMQYSRSLAPPSGGLKCAEMNDAQLAESIRSMGLEVTDENRRKVRQMMTQARDRMKNMKLRGTSTELYTKVSTPALKKGDFVFVPPKDAVLKESLFGGLLDGKPLPGSPAPPANNAPLHRKVGFRSSVDNQQARAGDGATTSSLARHGCRGARHAFGQCNGLPDGGR